LSKANEKRVHGLYSSYTWGCRCKLCKKANNEYKKTRRDFVRDTLSTQKAEEEFLDCSNDYGVFWNKDALCRGSSVDKFFPVSENEEKVDYGPALKVCSSCGVKKDCLEYAVGTNQKFGVWGMTTPHQRKNMRSEEVKT